MANDVRIELSLDGEKQFNQALKACNSELKNMQTQVKATDAANRGAANTEEALTKKVEALGKASESAGKKVETMEKIVEKQKAAQQEAAKALEEARKEHGENSKEVEKAQQAYNNATNSVNKWETELNKAKIEETNINNELQKTEGFLDEAKGSADGCAKSIDGYGKEVKDSTDKTEDFVEAVGETKSLEAMKEIVSKIGAVFADLGDKALEAAKDLDKGYDTIVKKTGATGEAFKDLKKRANNIFGRMPVDMEDVGKALGEVNTRFKLSGEAAEATAEQFLKFARVNDTDVSNAIDDVQVAMAAFNVETKDVNSVLDVLSKTGQNTGADVANLSKKVVENATAFQQMGLDIYGAIDFMGRLEVAGADSNSVLSGMKRALKNATEQGKPFSEALADLEDAIINGTDDMDGLTVAYDLFGKSGAGVFEAVKNGQISFKDLADGTDILADSTDTLNSAYEGTLSGWDKMETASNKLKTIGSELTEAFYDAAAPAVDAFNDVLGEALNIFDSLPDEVKTVIGVIGGVGTQAAKIVPKIVELYTQMVTLKVMKSLSGDANGLSGGFKKLGGSAVTAGAVIGGVAAGLALCHEAAKQLTQDITEFASKTETLQTGYETTRDSIRDLQETINGYTTTQEKREAIEAAIAEVEETQRQAQRNYNDEVKDGKLAAEGMAEAMTGELDPLGELLDGLTNGAVRSSALTDAANAYKDAQDNTNETLENTNDDLATLQQMLADVEAEEQAATETVVNSEGEVVAARDASITKAGEELTAWQNLNAEQQKIAEDIAAAVTGMKDSITASVDSIGNFFEEVKEQETVHAEEMKQNFRDQIAAVQEWEENLATLADKGINQEFLQYLADMGPSAANYVEAMKEDVLAGGQDTVDEWNAIYQDKLDLEGATNEEGQHLLEAIGNLAAGGEEKFNEVAEALNAKANEVGKYEVDGLVNGINEAKAQAEEAANQLGEGTVDAIAAGAQTQSPSKATMETGRNIDRGLIKGMAQQKAAAIAKAREIGNAVINAIKNLGLPAKAQAEGAKVGTNLVKGMNSQRSSARVVGRELGNSVIDALKALDLSDKARKVGEKAGQGLVSGMRSKRGDVRSTARELAGGIGEALKSKSEANYNAAQSVMRQVNKGITEGAKNSREVAKTAGNSIANALGNGITAGGATAKAAASSLASSVSANAKAVDTAGAYYAGYSLSSNIASGISAGSALAINAAIQMARQALNAAKNQLGISTSSSLVSGGLPDMSVYQAVPSVYVYLGDRELTGIMTQGVVKNITGGVRAYGAAGGLR